MSGGEAPDVPSSFSRRFRASRRSAAGNCVHCWTTWSRASLLLPHADVDVYERMGHGRDLATERPDIECRHAVGNQHHGRRQQRRLKWKNHAPALSIAFPPSRYPASRVDARPPTRCRYICTGRRETPPAVPRSDEHSRSRQAAPAAFRLLVVLTQVPSAECGQAALRAEMGSHAETTSRGSVRSVGAKIIPARIAFRQFLE